MLWLTTMRNMKIVLIAFLHLKNYTDYCSMIIEAEWSIPLCAIRNDVYLTAEEMGMAEIPQLQYLKI